LIFMETCCNFQQVLKGEGSGEGEESGASNKVKTQSITTIAVVIAKADLLEISLFVQNVTKDMTKWMANQFFRETVKTVKNKKKYM